MRTILGVKINHLSRVIILFLFFFATSCTKDEHIDVESQYGDGLTFELNISATTQVATRSVASSEELMIKKNSCLIVFNSDGSYNIHESITDAKITTGTNGTVNPEISFDEIYPKALPTGAKLVFILNAQSSPIIDETYTYTNINNKFPLVDYGLSTAGDGVPMYGELIGWNNTTGTSTQIQIKRSVAKLQVQVFSQIKGTNADNFATPASVTYQIFNYAKNGKFKESVQGELIYSDMNSAPTTDAILNTDINRNVAIVTGKDKDTKGAVYLCEFPYSTKIIGENKSTDILSSVLSKDRLAIIVKSSHNNRFYRLDLCYPSPEYVDIIRNHHYRIVIMEVNDNGHANADIAFKAPASNIEYNIIDDTGHTTISNGQYAISIGEELWGGGEVEVPVGAVTIDVATNVRWITHNGAALPIGVMSKIAIVGENDETEISGATVSPKVLTADLVPLQFILDSSIESGTIVRFKITLGTLEYFSEPITIVRK